MSFILTSLLFILSLTLPTSTFADNQCQKLYSASALQEKPSLDLRELQAARSHALKPKQMSYQIWGDDKTETIVLIHGLGSSKATFSKVAPELAKKYRVIAVDLRGHGESAKAGTDYSTYQMAEDVNSLLKSLKLKSFHLLGHSLGARVAMRYASIYPDKVKSLIFEDMDMQKRQDDSPEKAAKHLKIGAVYASLKPIYKSEEDLVQALLPAFDGDLARAVRNAEKMAYHDEEDGLIHVTNNPEVITYFGFQGNVDDFQNELSTLPMPMLFLRADPKESPFFNNAGLIHLADHGRNYIIRQIPNSDHSIHKSAFRPFMSAVKNFLQKISP